MRSQAKTISIEDIYPLQAVKDGVIVGVKGTLTLGWEVTYPVAYTRDEEEYDSIISSLSAAIRVLPPYTVVHRQDMYLNETYDPTKDEERIDLITGKKKRMSFLRRSFFEHFRGRKYLTHHSYIYVTFASKGLIEKDGTGSGFFGFHAIPPIPDAKEFDIFLSKCTEFESIVTSTGLIRMKRLSDADWIGDPETGATGIIQQCMMLGDKGKILSDIRATAESVEVFDKKAIAFEIGESDYLPTQISSVSRVDSLSGIANEVFLSIGAKIGVNLKCEHIVNQIIEVPSQMEIDAELTRRRKKMTSGISSADNRLNAEEIQEFQDEAYKEGLFTVRTHVNVIAWSRSEEEELKLLGNISSSLTSMNITAVYNKHNTPVLWYAGIPGCAFEIGKESLLTGELKGLLCLMPMETFDNGMGSNAVARFCDRMRNIPLGVDLQRLARDRGWIDNYNAFVVGGSGTGKSFTMNTYLRNLYDNDESVFIIDVGDSYEGLCHIIHEESGGADGQYLSWDMAHPFSFSPFLGYRDWLTEEGELKQDEGGVNFMMSFLQTVWSPTTGWTSDMTPVLRKILRDFLIYARDKNLDNPVFDDFNEFLETVIASKIRHKTKTRESIREEMEVVMIRDLREKRTKSKKKVTEEDLQEIRLKVKEDTLNDDKLDLIIWDDIVKNGYFIGQTIVNETIFDINAFLRALDPYVGTGAFSFLMNAREPVDLFKSRFVVFEVDALSNVEDKKFYSLCILCIMNAFETKMRNDKIQFKNLIVEEAWKAIANETMAPYLAGLWKTARKFNASAVVVTQQISDIMSSDVIRDTILQNSSTRIILDQSNNQTNFDQLSDLLGLSLKAKNLILSMNRANNPDYKYKEVFIALGDKYYGVFANEVSEEEAVAYESAKDKKQAFLALAKLRASFIKAATEIADEIRRKKVA